jgi:Flp pilus assembly pilin Flp
MLKYYVAAQTRVADAVDGVKAHFKSLRDDQSGAAMIEYALIVGLIAVGAIVVLGTLSTSLNGRITNISTKLAATGT